MKQIFETDWLASQPIFYNEKLGKVSHNINDVIDLNNLEFHPEGFNNYLDFGYSVFGQTPIQNVKFLRYSSQVSVDTSGKIEVIHQDDPVEAWIGKTSHEDDVFNLLYTQVRDWEQSSEGEIVIPTSGGYDSRLLNLLIEDKSRIRSFTYGLSRNQSESFEVIHAKKISDILGTTWEQIDLGEFHLYLDEWDRHFGVSTHAHGMYHFEFYHKILPKLKNPGLFLSGIFGDIWAGNTQYQELCYEKDIQRISYNHGLNASSKYSLLKCNYEIRNEFWEIHKEKLQQELYQVVWLIRLKIILISYLIRVPSIFGFQPWSPFLVQEVALSMLTLPPERRKNRIWQKEFFQKHGLDLESMNLQANRSNYLNHQAMRLIPVKPLDPELLKEVVKTDYVNWINRYVSPQLTLWDLLWTIRKVPKLRKFIYMFKVKDKRLQAYSAYLTLKPIENLIKKRNQTLCA